MPGLFDDLPFDDNATDEGGVSVSGLFDDLPFDDQPSDPPDNDAYRWISADDDFSAQEDTEQWRLLNDLPATDSTQDQGFFGNAGDLAAQSVTSAKANYAALLATGQWDNLDEDSRNSLIDTIVSGNKAYDRPEELTQYLDTVGKEAEDVGAAWTEGDYGNAAIQALDFLGETLYEGITNPKGFAYATTEQAANLAGTWLPGIAMGKGGAAIGSVAGPGGAAVGGAAGFFTGSALGSYLTETGAQIREFITKRGGDPTNPESIRQALSDPEVRSQMLADASKKGLSIAAFDAAANLLGLKLMKGATGPGSAALRGSGAMAAQVGGAAGGEITGQYASTGEVNAREVGAEVALEMGPGGFVDIALASNAARVKTDPVATAPIQSVDAEPEGLIESEQALADEINTADSQDDLAAALRGESPTVEQEKPVITKDDWFTNFDPEERIMQIQMEIQAIRKGDKGREYEELGFDKKDVEASLFRALEDARQEVELLKADPVRAQRREDAVAAFTQEEVVPTDTGTLSDEVQAQRLAEDLADEANATVIEPVQEVARPEIPAASELSKLKVAELRKLAESLGLNSRGLKPQLIDRIADARVGTAEAQKIEYADDRLGYETYRNDIRGFLQQNWVENGGVSLVPAPGAKRRDNTGDVYYDFGGDVIRTESVNPEWVQSLVQQVGRKELFEIIDRAVDGDTTLTDRHKSFLATILDEMDGGVSGQFIPQNTATFEDIQARDKGAPMAQEPEILAQEDYDSPVEYDGALSLAELEAEASALGFGDEAVTLMSSSNDDATVARNLFNIINGNDNDTARTTQSGSELGQTEETGIIEDGRRLDSPGQASLRQGSELPAQSEATTVANQGSDQEGLRQSDEVKVDTKAFAPPALPTLVDRRNNADLEISEDKTDNTYISGGEKEGDIVNRDTAKRKLAKVGFDQAKWQDIPEGFEQRVFESYPQDTLNKVKFVDGSETRYKGAHHNGAIALDDKLLHKWHYESVGHVLAHELGHASHSLLGDQLNNNQQVIAELKAVEDFLYPGLRGDITTTMQDAEKAKGVDVEFLNYLLSPEELVAEFNVSRLIDPAKANRVAPVLSSLLESAANNPNLVVERNAFPTGWTLIGKPVVPTVGNFDPQSKPVESYSDLPREKKSFALEQPTEEGLKQAQDKIDAVKAEEDAAIEKAKIDQDVDNFNLTGSDLAADANPAQADLLDENNAPGVASFDEFANMSRSKLNQTLAEYSLPGRKGESNQDSIARLKLAEEAIKTLSKYNSRQEVEAAIKAGEIDKQKVFEWASAVTPRNKMSGLSDINFSLNVSHLVKFGNKSGAFTLVSDNNFQEVQDRIVETDNADYQAAVEYLADKNEARLLTMQQELGWDFKQASPVWKQLKQDGLIGESLPNGNSEVVKTAEADIPTEVTGDLVERAVTDFGFSQEQAEKAIRYMTNNELVINNNGQRELRDNRAWRKEALQRAIDGQDRRDNAGKRWEAIDEATKTQWIIAAGWKTKANKLNAAGKRLLSKTWAEVDATSQDILVKDNPFMAEDIEATGMMDAETFELLLNDDGMGQYFNNNEGRTVTAQRVAQSGGTISESEAKQRIGEWKKHALKQGENNGQNNDKVILSLFDRTGEWSKPWVDAGYQVYTFDIQNMPEGEVDAESLDFLQDIENWNYENLAEMFPQDDVYGILAACPCTDFASSGAQYFKLKDLLGNTNKSKDLVYQTMNAVELFRPHFWVIENPVGRIESATGLPKARMTFDPAHFGNPYTKKTVLWGQFNTELPLAPVEPTLGSMMHSNFGGNTEATKNARSITPEGFAYAFFMANNEADKNQVDRVHGRFHQVKKPLIKKALDAGMAEQDIKDLLMENYFEFGPEETNAELQKAIDALPPVEQSQTKPKFDRTESTPQSQRSEKKTELSALHNLSADNLIYADKMGGLAVPSIAIAKGDMAHTGYGEITLIGTKALGDPEQTEVYDSDAWSTRHPKPEYNKAKPSKAQALFDEVNPWVKKYSQGYSYAAEAIFEEGVNNPSPERIADAWFNNDGIKALFIKETTGRDVRVPTKAAPQNLTESSDPEIVAFIKNLPDNYEDLGASSDVQINARRGLAPLLEKAIREKYANRPDLADRLVDTAIDNGEVVYTAFERIKGDVARQGKTVIDGALLGERLRKQLKGKEAQYQQWMNDKILSIFGEPFVRVRGKKLPYTLENIVAAMTVTSTQSQEKSLAFGEGKARAAAATKFTDLEWMRNAAESGIVSEENLEQAQKETKRLTQEYRDSVIDYYQNLNWRGEVDTWSALDDSMKALSDWLSGSKRGGDVSSFRAALRKNDFTNVPNEVIEKGIKAANALKYAPVAYFEAKPTRSVMLNEFAGAVVPSNVSQEVLDILEKNNIPVRKYNRRADPSVRTKAVINFRKQLARQGKDVLFDRTESTPVESTPVEEVLPFEEVEALANSLAGTGIGKQSTIEVVENEDALPPNLIEQAEAEGARYSILGAVDNGIIYVVADRMTDPARVEETVLHESGHLGLEALLGEGNKAAYQKLWLRLGGDKGIKDLAEQGGFAERLDPYFETADNQVEAGNFTGQDRRAFLADEFIALAQGEKAYATLPEKVKGAIKEFIGYVRDRVRNLGLAKLAEFNDADLAYLLRSVNNAWRGKETTGTQSARAKFMVAWHGAPDSAETISRFNRAPKPKKDPGTVSVVIGKDKDGKDVIVQSDHPTLRDLTRLRKAQNWIKRWFAKEGLLGDEAFKRHVETMGMKNGDEIDIQFFANGLQVAIKKAYGKRYEKLTPQQQADLNDALQGEQVNLPDEVQEAIDVMRVTIDKMSAKMQRVVLDEIGYRLDQLSENNRLAALDVIARAVRGEEIADEEWGGIDPIVAQKARTYLTIEANKGHYTNRSYAVFDDPKWEQKIRKDADVMRAARVYLANALDPNAEMPSNERKDMIEGLINKILRAGSDSSSILDFMGSSQLGQKDLSIIKKRKEIAPEIRELLGEYKDPRVNFIRTVSKMSYVVANHHFLKTVREDALGVYLSTEPSGRMSTEITSFDNNEMLPLTGLYATPEFAQALRDAVDKTRPEGWLKWWLRGNSSVKVGKTILSPTTSARNFYSAMMFSVANGHFNPLHAFRAASHTWADLGLTGNRNQAKRAYLTELAKLGVLHDNPYAGELSDLLNDIAEMDTLKGSKPVRMTKATMNFLTRVYRAGDDFWKIIGFENEKNSLMRGGMAEAEAKVKAAERIRNGYPTYSMVPKGIRSIRRFPIVGTFVSFPWEMIRTSYQMTRILAEDAKMGRGAAVARRAVGMSIAASLAQTLSLITMEMMGLTDDDDEAIRKVAPEWQRNSQLLYLGYDEKGQPRYLDMSHLDPYTYLKAPVTAFLNSNNKTFGDKATDAAWSMLEPFFGEEITFKSMRQALSNTNDFGNPIYNEYDKPEVKGAKFLGYLFGVYPVTDKTGKLMPGVMTNLERTMKAALQKKSAAGRVFDLNDELLSWVGFRFTTLDMKTSLKFAASEYREFKSQSGRPLRAVMTNPNLDSADRVADAYAESALLFKGNWEEMRAVVVAAQALGVNRKDTVDALLSAGMSKNDVRYLLAGKMPKFMPSEKSLKGMRKQLIQGSEDRGAMFKEWTARMRALRGAMAE